MVSSLLTYKVRGGKSRGKEGKAHNSKAILIPSARKNTLPPHTSCYLPGGLRAIQMCAILPYRANSLSMSRSVASGSRFPTYTLASGMLACLLLLRDDDDGSGRGGGAREGVWTREGSKTCVADHKAKGGAAEGQGVVVVVVVVVPAGVALLCRCSRGTGRPPCMALGRRQPSRLVLFLSTTRYWCHSSIWLFALPPPHGGEASHALH